MLDVIDEIEQLFRDKGRENYGEDVSQLEHAVQCAELAVRAGESDALVTAALLHDIGHLLDPVDPETGNYRHDAVGAAYLQAHFPQAVCEPIRQHAQAKRYLCAREPGYLSGLSEASLDSLAHQGGPMSEDEQRAFAATPYARESLKLRRWDDTAKDTELCSRDFADYLPYLRASLSPETGGQAAPPTRP